MKLILCNQCNDLLRLTYDIRNCKCGASSFVYIDHLNAIYSGPCIPLGIDNESLSKAVHRRDTVLHNNSFTAFVVSDDSETFIKVEDVKTSKKQKSKK